MESRRLQKCRAYGFENLKNVKLTASEKENFFARYENAKELLETYSLEKLKAERKQKMIMLPCSLPPSRKAGCVRARKRSKKRHICATRMRHSAAADRPKKQGQFLPKCKSKNSAHWLMRHF